MKTVHTRAMVAHLWANKAQEFARTGNGSFFFEGEKIYSYGKHYLAAIRTPWVDDNGKTVILINGDHYSSTTQRHISDIKRALYRHNVVTFDVHCMASDMPHNMPSRVIADCLGTIQNELKTLRNIRAEWKKARVIEKAKQCATLATIAARYIGKDEPLRKAVLREMGQTLPLIPDVADKETMKRVSIELGKVDDRNEVDALTRQITGRLASVAGWIDSQGAYAELGVDLPASTSDLVYLNSWRTCFDTVNHVCLKRARVEFLCKRQQFAIPKKLISKKALDKVHAFVDAKVSAEWLKELDAFCRRSILRYRKGEIIAPDSSLTFTQAKYLELSPQLQLIVDTARKAYAKQERMRRLSFVKHEGARDIQRAINNARVELAENDAFSARGYYRTGLAHYEKARAITDGLSDKARAYFMVDYDYALENEAREFVETFDAKQKELNAQAIEDWRNGQGTMTSARRFSDSPLCRYNAKSNRCETSWGAEMPVGHARGVWLAIQRAKKTGKEYAPVNSGDSVVMGAFKLDKALPDGSIIAGCHHIKASELEYIARVLGLTDESITESVGGE